MPDKKRPKDPDSRRPMILRSVIEALNTGKPEAAAAACSTLLAETPNDPSINELAAVAALRTGRHHDAKAFSRRAIAARPDHAPTLILFGRAARALGDDAEAAAAFRQATLCAPERAEPAFLLCALLLKAGNPEAQLMLDQLLGRFPREAAGWEDIAQVLLALGKGEAALVCLARAAEVAPRFALAMRRGLICKDLGRAKEAARAFAEAVALDPQAARAWFLLGLSSQDTRDFATAEAAYRSALAVDPTLAEAAVNLGTLLQETGDLDAAKTAYGQAVKLRPDSFGRIAQAMTTAPRGELWLDLGELRRTLLR